MKADEFIREVDEAVRQERWLTLWKRFGSYLIGAVVAILIGTAAGVGWREYQESARLDEARRFAQASELLRVDRTAEAAEAFATLAEDGRSGYAVLARLRAAEARDADARVATLQQLAENTRVAVLYRELSALLAAQHQFEQEDGAALSARLDEFARDGSPWRHSALELKALAQIRAGDTLAARETLSALIEDTGVPANLRRRASELLTALGGPVETAAGDGASE